MNVERLIILSLLLASLTGLSCSQNEMNENAASGDASLNAPGNADGNITPTVTVEDQTITGDQVVGEVTVAEVVSDGPGWIVIHNDLFGHPGGVIGYAQVEGGRSGDVPVTIHTFVATDSLFAVLHYDRGEEGVFEYPVPDTEQQADGQIVIQPFRVVAPSATLMNLTQMAMGSAS